MLYDLSPGDTLLVGDDVALTVVDVDGALVRLRLELPGPRRPEGDRDRQQDDPLQDRW